MYGISDSHSSEVGLLGSSFMWTCRYIQIIQRNILSPSSMPIVYIFIVFHTSVLSQSQISLLKSLV